MKTASFFVVACSLVASFVVACSSDSSSGGGGGADGGSTADSGGGGNDASAQNDSSSNQDSSTQNDGSTSDAAATLDCTSYCSAVQANCTGANAQFTDTTTCMNFCATYPAGALADMSGDTLGCRIYHANAAAGAGATLHCPHAGPTGGDKDPKGTSGVCGEPCEAFCNAAQTICTGVNQQFADKATCMTACAGFKADVASYSTADTSTNDMGCRFYHLSAASKDATSATTHCPHIVPNSAVCTQ